MSPQADELVAPTHEDIRRRIALLRTWLVRRLSVDQAGWLDEQIERISKEPQSNGLATAIGLASRRLGKGPLAPEDEERSAATTVRAGLDPRDWSIDQTARILFVLVGFKETANGFSRWLDAFLRSAEIGEQIALYRGLPLYFMPVTLLPIAGEGIRSAVQPVFEAVAHNSPYPVETFTDAMWNQMVVKALFVGSRLAPIQGLDDRRNADLARMLVDYAHERWAAHRDVSPELWRCVGPFADDESFNDLVKVLSSSQRAERQAAALALSECPRLEALMVLESAPELWRDIRNEKLTWETLA
jgi:hypothetical protein